MALDLGVLFGSLSSTQTDAKVKLCQFEKFYMYLVKCTESSYWFSHEESIIRNFEHNFYDHMFKPKKNQTRCVSFTKQFLFQQRVKIQGLENVIQYLS